LIAVAGAPPTDFPDLPAVSLSGEMVGAQGIRPAVRAAHRARRKRISKAEGKNKNFAPVAVQIRLERMRPSAWSKTQAAVDGAFVKSVNEQTHLKARGGALRQLPGEVALGSCRRIFTQSKICLYAL